MIIGIKREELERAANDMCDHYCRYPLLWDEQVMNQELQESELCRNCPMTKLQYPLGKNEWQE